jgi:transcriptional regulator with XRE-family HTH domain
VARNGTLAERLARLRKEKGLSQKELAERAGVSARIVAYYETETSRSYLAKIEKIAAALGVSIAELLDGAPQQTADKTEFLSSVNTKTLKQFRKLLQLSPQDRSTIYRMVDGLLRK